MMKICFRLILLCISISSCKVTEKDIIGFYELNGFPKTTLTLHSDKSFEFSKNRRDPYLLPFDHEDEYFVDTKGSWRIVDKKFISLDSQSDTLAYPLVSFQTYPATYNDMSRFTFYDQYGDTVKINYVQYSDSTIYSIFHMSMAYYTEDLMKRDTLEFHFYGYRPYILISGQKVNKDFEFHLKPIFQPKYFLNKMFRIKRKKIIDMKRKYKFNQIKKRVS